MNVHKLEGLLKQAKELLLSGNNEDTRRLIDTFIDKVVVYTDCVEVVANPASFVQHANYTKTSQEIPRK